MEEKFSNLEYGVMAFTVLLLIVWSIASVGSGMTVGGMLSGAAGLAAMAAALWTF